MSRTRLRTAYRRCCRRRAYLSAYGQLDDPAVAPAIDPANDTIGGNFIQDQNINLHARSGTTSRPTSAMPRPGTDRGRVGTLRRALPLKYCGGWRATRSSLPTRPSRLTFTFNPPQPPSTLNPVDGRVRGPHSRWRISGWRTMIKRERLAKGGARAGRNPERDLALARLHRRPRHPISQQNSESRNRCAA